MHLSLCVIKVVSPAVSQVSYINVMSTCDMTSL